jgi:hypothetical protein
LVAAVAHASLPMIIRFLSYAFSRLPFIFIYLVIQRTMLSRLLIVFMILCITDMSRIMCNQLVGGWTLSGPGELQDEMIHLARNTSEAYYGSTSTIDVNAFYTQIVAGMNLRLEFTLDEQSTCTLTAFKPLPFRKKLTEVTNFNCESFESDQD